MTRKVFFLIVASFAWSTHPICHAENEGALEQDMEQMNRAFKTLKRQIASPTQKASNLEAIAKMKKGATAALDTVPEKAEKIPQADRAKFLQDFKASISELVAEIVKLEKAVQEDRLPDAQKALDEINELKRDGHSTFVEKKEK